MHVVSHSTRFCLSSLRYRAIDWISIGANESTLHICQPLRWFPIIATLRVKPVPKMMLEVVACALNGEYLMSELQPTTRAGVRARENVENSPSLWRRLRDFNA